MPKTAISGMSTEGFVATLADKIRSPAGASTPHPSIRPIHQTEVVWSQNEQGTYRCAVDLLREEDGRYSVWVANLPGVVSQGDTQEEALANIQEAFKAVIESYKAASEAIPWI